jgi:hypothetical protein
VESRNPKLTEAERAMLEHFLDAARAKVVRAGERVAPADAGLSGVTGSDLTVGGVVMHLARMEDLWFNRKWDDVPPSEPWASAPFDVDADWDFHAGAGQDLTVSLDLYRAACEASRRRAARVRSLDDHSARGSFGQGPTSLRWIYLHMIEETAQHCGHIDLLADAAAAARD